MAIPTLTDIGNRIVQGVGTLTGQIRNPFDDMIAQLEERLQSTNNEDEIVKLNDQLRTLRAASDEWSSYDVAKQDPTAAPEWMQTIHNAARVGGDNLDLVDVGTAFIPVGVATKGATRFGTDFERGAEWLASHPVIGGATEQGLIEGAHGAASYNPEYGESMGLNALEQGGLAGLMQGGISALGGRRLRAIGALPENVKIQEGLSELGSRGIEVPNYDPLRRAGMTSIDPGDANILIARETDRINNAIPSSTKINSSGAQKDITDVEKKMRSGDIKEPFKPAGNSPWRSDIGGYMHRVWQPYSPYEELIPLRDLVNTIPYGHPRPHVFVMQRGVGGPRVFTDQESISAMANADNLLRRRLLERKGLGGAADILEQSPKNITELQGLAGLHYSPLPKGAISNRMADIYSAQTEPLNGFGTAGYRAAYNALLDALREGAEGGLDGLYGLGYVDE